MSRAGDERARARLDALMEATRVDSTRDRDPETAALAERLARAGEALRTNALSPARAARFHARVLARTTRQEPSWRGDLHLWLDFLRTRLRASPAMRLVTALLVLELAATPALALWALVRSASPPEPVRITIELPPAQSPFAEAEPAPAPVTDAVAERAREREARENETARERFVLLGRGAGAPRGAANDRPDVVLLLDARAQLLAGAPSAESGPPPTEPLALALWTELELDRRVLLGRQSPQLETVCQSLEELVGGTPLRDERPAALALLERARTRARALGVGATSLPALNVGLLDRAWFAALERAGREAGVERDALWNAWVAWGVE